VRAASHAHAIMNQQCRSGGRGDFAAHRGTTYPVFVHDSCLSTINL
jgi:hypothetical protein